MWGPRSQAVLSRSADRAGERLTGRPLTRWVVLAMIKWRGLRPRAAASDVLPHVPGDWDHGILVEWGNP